MNNIEMKVCVLTLFFFTSIVLSAQTGQINQTDSKGKKQGYWKKYENGVLQYEGTFVNDVPTGVFTYYHENGQLKSKTNFINGTHKVQTTLYHTNGKISAHGAFVDQRKDGTWLYYSSGEMLIREENYKRGVKHGNWKTYSAQTGILLTDENYDQSVLHGEYRLYYTNGELNSITPYILGKRNGTYEEYSLDGKLKKKGVFHNDKLIGSWDYFDEDGRVRKSVEYKNGMKEKEYIYFYTGRGSSALSQRFNTRLIAYIQKEDEKIKVVTYNGQEVKYSHSIDEIEYWLDDIDFVRITPSIITAFENLRSYQEIDEEELVVKLKKGPPFEIIVKGEYATLIRAFFRGDKPVMEE